MKESAHEKLLICEILELFVDEKCVGHGEGKVETKVTEKGL